MNLHILALNPQKTTFVIFSFVLALIVSWVAIPIIINVCRLRNILEPPKRRGSHENATPILGGIAIFAGTLISFMLFGDGEDVVVTNKIIAGVISLFFLGIKDDLFGLSPSKKIVAQILAGGFVVIGADLRISSWYGIFGIYDLPYLGSVCFSIFIFIALINAINLIDGIDGLAAGIGTIVSITFCIYFLRYQYYAFAFLSASLAGALIGFMRFNFSKTNKIFMGDTGSLIVGHLLTAFAIKFLASNLPTVQEGVFVKAPVMAIMVFIVPIFDTLRVFSIRILKRKSPFSADRGHFHHLLIDNGLQHRQATFLLCSTTIFLVLCTYWLADTFSINQFVFIICILFGIYILTGKILEMRKLKLLQEKRQESAQLMVEVAS